MAVLLGPLSAGVASATSAPPHTPTAHHFDGMATVGALFPPGSSVHTCTASVVDSGRGDVLLTAAHCISGTGAGYVFAPGYRDGVEPFGSWTVIGAYGASGWLSEQAAQRDFAFLVVAPRRSDGRTQQIQSVTGANLLGTAPSAGEQITVPAYPLGRDDEPITCTARVYRYAGYPAFNCTPYTDGTSGAPWLRRSGHRWLVVGVVGGLHQGGCEPWTSYSAAFGSVTVRTDTRAATGTDASVFPTPNSDGCSAPL
jgi:V8-like Glu-specific endopeptidase